MGYVMNQYPPNKQMSHLNYKALWYKIPTQVSRGIWKQKFYCQTIVRSRCHHSENCKKFPLNQKKIQDLLPQAQHNQQTKGCCWDMHSFARITPLMMITFLSNLLLSKLTKSLLELVHSSVCGCRQNYSVPRASMHQMGGSLRYERQ